jgi:hypothetical protein
MSAAPGAIPYERQSDPQASRTCGAACLSMVYRSFGKEVPQAEIWAAIAKENRFGSLASTTHLMAQDALTRGLCAVAIQARHPLQVLRICRAGGIRAILNHRMKPDSPTGHYSVLAGLDSKNVVFHDPSSGPSQSLPHAELLDLWQPRSIDSEIVGNVLIAVSAEPMAVPACEFCHTPILSEVECPRCNKPVGLQPAAILGCMNNGCIARMWNYICCPACDYMWTFGMQSPPTGAGAPSVSTPATQPQAAPEPAEDPWKLDQVFGAMDKFCSYILSLPAAATRPEIRQQIEFMIASKEKLKLAQAESFANRAAAEARMAALLQAAQQKEEAHRQKVEKLNTPSPPLDGSALGRALLKNLGFTK